MGQERNKNGVTSFRADESARLTDKFVASLVGINQLSFLPFNNHKHCYGIVILSL